MYECSAPSRPPLIAHIVYRFAVGGLENGIVNLVNATPPERYCHAIISLTDFTDFRNRIRNPEVPVIALHKRAGNDFRAHLRLWRLLKTLRPAIVHTRNIGALEYLLVAASAAVRGRVHGEHGRDMYDLQGANLKYNLLRKAIRPLVHRYISVSEDMANWLVHTVGVRPAQVTHICNGVDTLRFRPRTCGYAPIGPEGFSSPGTFVVGTVGRMEAVKDQLTLVRAFIHLLDTEPRSRERLRIVMVGDGPLREKAAMLLREAHAEQISWLPGERRDIPEIMRSMDVFVLPSLAEGISNTILEAMASGVPVVATRVGGNPELVGDGRTGRLVPSSEPVMMAGAIRGYLSNPEQRLLHGQAGRAKTEACFSIDAMVNGYLSVYDAVLRNKTEVVSRLRRRT